MSPPPSSRVAVVTGASRGIGSAIAETLAAEGLFVYVNYRASEKEASEVVAKIEAKGGKARAIAFDVATSAAVDSAFEEINRESGGVDVLINNAGVAVDGLVLRTRDDGWKKTIDINLSGSLYCARAALKTMLRRKKEGRIVFISSVVGQMGNMGQAAYAASKSAAFGMSRSIAREVASRGITVNVVAPGFVRTEMTDRLTPEQKDGLLKSVPLGRWAEPEEIASVVRFLVSEPASYITGQVIAVNGGMNL